FTLIELVIVIVVVGVIASVFAILIIQGIDTYGFITIREDILSEAELAMERMVREIRQVQTYQSLLVAQATEVIYLADSTEFQFVDVHNDIIGFKRSELDVTKLLRQRFVEPGGGLEHDDLLAEDISSLVFQYWGWDAINELWELLPTPLIPEDINRIKRIEISIQMDRQNQEVRIDTQVYPRNL
ncbi:prepilin-type N-terminal cleavage/methylation domain-containing protein, partial [bacterium]|nr:prepilin-type N-terminal cleavage/methylation domain-containing protein [bacterium]